MDHQGRGKSLERTPDVGPIVARNVLRLYLSTDRLMSCLEEFMRC